MNRMPVWAIPSDLPLTRPTVEDPLPGSRYDQLGRTPLHRWWRPLMVLLLTLVYWMGFCLPLLAAAGIYGEVTGPPTDEDQIVADPTLDTAALLLFLANAIPATLLAARWPGRRPPGTLLSVAVRMRWRWLGLCMAFAFAVAVVLFAVSEALLPGDDVVDLGWVGLSAFVGPALMLLVLVPLQSAGEEFLFRGLLPQVFGAYLRSPIPGLVMSSLLFALGHGLGTWWGLADLLLFSLVTNVLTLRTGGLEAAIALHAMTNLVGFLLLAASGPLDFDTTAADAPWQVLAIELVLLPAYAAVILKLARRHQLATRSGPADPTFHEPAERLQ